MIFAAALLALAACNKSLENGKSEKQYKPGETITLTAKVSNVATKVTSDNIDASTVNFKWQKGDKVLLFHMNGDYTAVTESQVFTIKDETINSDGTSADFTGKALSSMKSYFALYCGTNADPIKVTEGNNGGNLTLDNFDNNLNLFAPGSGDADGFAFEVFYTTIHLKLTGDVTIGKVEYVCGGQARTTINCKNGVVLTSTPQDFLIPCMYAMMTGGFDLKFYDMSGALVMTKHNDSNALYGLDSGLVSFPELEVKASPSIPEGALPGVFSVSADKTVYFSKGNLQATYNGSSYTWGFAANQYDYVGNAAGNTSIDSQSSGATVDLFGWSTSATTYGINTSTTPSTYSGDFKDWGKTIDNKGTWRTLSGGDSGEWKYLLSTRTVNGGTGEGSSYQRATIRSDVSGGVYGLIIYPDNYTSQTTATSYTSTDWDTMKSAGCVFLPAAGYRVGSSVYSVDSYGYYWSSSPYDTSNAYELGFLNNNNNVFPAVCDERKYGYSVRLVCAAE